MKPASIRRSTASPGHSLANFVQGANEGFQKKLEIQGVGFKAALQGKSPQPQPRLFAPD